MATRTRKAVEAKAKQAPQTDEIEETTFSEVEEVPETATDSYVAEQQQLPGVFVLREKDAEGRITASPVPMGTVEADQMWTLLNLAIKKLETDMGITR